MSTETTNYGLKKPSADEFYDISVHNDNADIIDARMKENAEVAENAGRHIADKRVHITEEERKNWDDADSKKHGHSNKGVLDATTASYTTADKAKLDGMAEVATSGNYNDLSGKPTIPTVGNGTVMIKQAGVQKGTFTMNQSGNTTIELADNNTTYSAATATAAGLMSAADKKKLDGITSGANAYTHPNSGVAAGTYRSVAVNAQGHVTGGSNPVLTVAQGGTGATTAAQALANIGAAAASHTHSYAGSTSAGGTAIRALGDSDGAQINATYRKKAEGSVVRIQASAPEDTTALWVS